MRVAGFVVALFGAAVTAEHPAVQPADRQQHAGASVPASAATDEEHKAATVPSHSSAAAGKQLAGRGEHDAAADRRGTARAQGDAVSKAQKAAGDAKQLASSRIARIEEDVQQLESDLRNGQHAVNLAHSIMSDASREFKEKRLEAEAAFKTKLRALTATETQSASGDAVKAAVEAAHAAENKLTKVQHEMFHAVRASFRAQRRAAKAHTRNLWSEARKAAHQARHASDDVSKAMRKAGVHEEVYETEQLHSENIGERLLGQAEEAAERGEGLVEDQFERVEHNLERLEDTYRDEVEHDHAERARLLREAAHKAIAAVVRARQAAPPAAAQAAPAKSAHKAEAAPPAAAQAAPAESAHKAEAEAAPPAAGQETPAKSADSAHNAESHGAGGPHGKTNGAVERSQVAFLAPVTDFTEGFTMPAIGSALLAGTSAVVLAGVVITRRHAVQLGEQPALG